MHLDTDECAFRVEPGDRRPAPIRMHGLDQCPRLRKLRVHVVHPKFLPLRINDLRMWHKQIRFFAFPGGCVALRLHTVDKVLFTSWCDTFSHRFREAWRVCRNPQFYTVRIDACAFGLWSCGINFVTKVVHALRLLLFDLRAGPPWVNVLWLRFVALWIIRVRSRLLALWFIDFAAIFQSYGIHRVCTGLPTIRFGDVLASLFASWFVDFCFGFLAPRVITVVARCWKVRFWYLDPRAGRGRISRHLHPLRICHKTAGVLCGWLSHNEPAQRS
mmetsp:Transcript_130139/g.239275  ORF Transcript_130139/g.239275 Transcript_130139/m.239275 type:complete len:273 (-) Transcript_130139:764-1582(-)